MASTLRHCRIFFIVLSVIAAFTDAANNINIRWLCSDIFCDDELVNRSECQTIVNECTCTSDWTMYCPNFSPNGLRFMYNRYSRLLRLSGQETQEDFDTAIQYFSKYIDVVECYGVTITNFCCKRDGIMHSHPCALNLSRFPKSDKILKMAFANNCFVKIIGIFAAISQNLQEVDLSNNQLEYIPEELFSDLRFLEILRINSNKIQLINNSTFLGLTSLTSLRLEDNMIDSPDVNIFQDLSQLEILDLSSNQIQHLHPRIFQTLTKLTKLNLSYNSLQRLDVHLFNGLRELLTLDLSHNIVLDIPSELFVTNYAMVEVELSYNFIKQIPTLKLGSFRIGGPPKFILRHNNITALQIPITTIPGSMKLDLSENCIVDVQQTENGLIFPRFMQFECSKCCLSSVDPYLLRGVIGTANLSHNNLRILDMKMLGILAALKLDQIDLSYNLIERINVSWDYPLVTNVTPTLIGWGRRINLQMNRVICDCDILTFLQFLDPFFNEPKNMSRSDIRFNVTGVICKEPEALLNVPIDAILRSKQFYDHIVCNITAGCPSGCHCYHMAIRNVNVVNCSSVGLSYFPTLQSLEGRKLVLHLENNSIKNLPSKSSRLWNLIQELYLDNNSLSSTENITITQVLKVFHLRRNRLKHIGRILEVLEGNVLVSLSENPWECNCELYNMKPQLFGQDNVIDFAQLTCFTKDTHNQINVANATDYDLCPEIIPNHMLLKCLLATFVSLFVLGCLCVSLAYKYRSEIQFWMFKNNVCLTVVTEEDVDANKLYDAFVSYSTLDEEWVARHLLPELEGGNPAYQLCLHSRDWIVGDWIPEQIFRSVDQSRRTICVLTDNYINSIWTRLEFYAALRQALTDRVNRVLIVVPGDLPDLSKIDHELRTFVTLNTYIKWTESHFWHKLRCAMPRMRTNMFRK